MARKLTTKSTALEYNPGNSARDLASSTSIVSTEQQAVEVQGGSACVRRRSSDWITAKQITNVLAALDHAKHLGWSPTHHITIDWEAAGVVDSIAATGRFLRLLKQAAASKGWKTMHIWVREDGPLLGEHVHILISLPYGVGRWLGRLKPDWLKACGAKRGKGISKTTRVIGRPLSDTPFEPMSNLYKVNTERAVSYVLKHCDPAIAITLGIRSNGVCVLTGKRVSISQNIGPSARAKCHECKQQGSA